MSNGPGMKGLILDEPLLWEKGKKGRNGFSIPVQDVPECTVNDEILGEAVDLPDLSEIDVVRHYTRLSQWNFGIDTGMYPLGSCTMKYNPKLNEKMSSVHGLAAAHPLLEDHFCQGTLRLMYELQRYLANITGMDSASLQPAAGAQGEMCGMLIFAGYFKSQGENRTKILIPDTAHGTNPASAALCGFKSVPLTSGPHGILDVAAVAEAMDEETAGIMLTNPNTLGLFEESIKDITRVVHEKGGLVYGDGANMNAAMGVIDFKACGIDVIHLNLHKTFSTPHGGGGPGAGPVCVIDKLDPFLPVPRAVKVAGGYALEDDYPLSIGRVHAFHGNFSVLIRAYSYILSMGPENLKQASHLAVLNANYVKELLRDTFELAYDRPCMHECVFSDKRQLPYKVTTLDMAKKLIDHGYHPPTIYFPLVVPGAIMIEPTESENKEDLDRFVNVFKSVAESAVSDPEGVKAAPVLTKVRRLDETQAARKPCLRG